MVDTKNLNTVLDYWKRGINGANPLPYNPYNENSTVISHPDFSVNDLNRQFLYSWL